jgi:hypothetical protein
MYVKKAELRMKKKNGEAGQRTQMEESQLKMEGISESEHKNLSNQKHETALFNEPFNDMRTTYRTRIFLSSGTAFFGVIF